VLHRAGPSSRLRPAALRTLMIRIVFACVVISATMNQRNNKTRLQAVQFEWEEEPQPRAVRLVTTSPPAGDPMRVTAAGVEVEGRIEAVESSTLHAAIWR
jgi:hypothetical protein